MEILKRQLKLNRLGRTKLMVSCIGLGGLGILSKYDNTPDSSNLLINKALDKGINFIDTARFYDDSEWRIGRAIKTRRSDCYLASKTMKRDYLSAIKELEQSLKNLCTDHIELYQIHHVQWEEELEKILSKNGALNALKDAKKQGIIDFIGITAHIPNIAINAIKTGEFDTIQLPYNPIDAKLFHKILLIAQKMDLGTIIMKPFAGGLLTTDPKLALRYILEKKVSTIIPGMSTLEHLNMDISVGYKIESLSKTEKRLLFNEAKLLGESFCRRCGYCLSECPIGIQIPDIFRFERYLDVYKTGHWAKKQYFNVNPKANECIDCGNCEDICPYKLPIRAMLQIAHQKLLQPITEKEYAYHGVSIKD